MRNEADRQAIPDTLSLVFQPNKILFWIRKPDLMTLVGPYYSAQEADAAVMRMVEMEGVIDL